jgi:hypothetical protein
MSNSLNRTYVERLLEEVRGAIVSINTERQIEDGQTLSDIISAANQEARALDPDFLEETFDVKGLHDRLHTAVVHLRVMRHGLDRIEHALEQTLDTARRLSHAVEPEAHDEDDAQL